MERREMELLKQQIQEHRSIDRQIDSVDGMYWLSERDYKLFCKLEQRERARIIAALEKLEHHGTWQDGRPMFWRADEVMRAVRGERDGNDID